MFKNKQVKYDNPKSKKLSAGEKSSTLMTFEKSTILIFKKPDLDLKKLPYIQKQSNLISKPSFYSPHPLK